MIWLLRYWKVGVALALAAALWGWGYYTARTAGLLVLQMERTRAEQVIGEFAKAERDAVQAARAAERRHADALARIAEQHEQDKRDAEQAAADVIAGLRAGTVRLRQHWQGCQATARVSGDAASRALADADARLREADAGAAIGDAKRADDWIKRLQEVIRTAGAGRDDGAAR